MNYRIIIKNSGNCEIYNEIVTAKNENEALKIILETEIICSGDSILIEEE